MQVDLSNCPSPYSFKNKITRVLWNTTWLFLFRSSPKICHFWRCFILKCFGAKMGKKRVYIYPSCKIIIPWKLIVGNNVCIGPNVECDNRGGISIGNNTTISQNVHLCSSSHDYTTSNMNQTFKGIIIEDQVWICSDVFIGPGVTIGQGAVVGARSVVIKDVQAWTVVGGNPARFIKNREIK
jgi:putative colanic acid biosynthesis acetyltransferase WcaF